MSQVIVVEGTHDVSRIKEVYKDLECIITNGSEISKETLEMIKELSKTNEIIVFTDPDYPGERIRNKIIEVCPNALHAFIKKQLCISKNKKKVGVEHASDKDIKDALNNLIKPSYVRGTLTMADLMSLDLAGNKTSKKRREELASKLNIGRPNGKTLLNRLNFLGYTKEELKKLVGDLIG